MLCSKATNIDLFESIEHLSMLTCRNRPSGNWNRRPNLVNHKIAPRRMKSPPGGRFRTRWRPLV